MLQMRVAGHPFVVPSLLAPRMCEARPYRCRAGPRGCWAGRAPAGTSRTDASYHCRKCSHTVARYQLALRRRRSRADSGRPDQVLLNPLAGLVLAVAASCWRAGPI